MPHVVFGDSLRSQQVDVPQGERSRKGSLHLAPGSMVLTFDEVAYLKKLPFIAPHMRVYDATPAETVLAPAPAPVVPPAPPAASEAPSAKEDLAPPPPPDEVAPTVSVEKPPKKR